MKEKNIACKKNRLDVLTAKLRIVLGHQQKQLNNFLCPSMDRKKMGVLLHAIVIYKKLAAATVSPSSSKYSHAAEPTVPGVVPLLV